MRFRQVLAVPVLGVLLATGCTGAESTDETNTTPLAATDLNPTARDAMVSGGELRLAVDEFGSLNPMAAAANGELARLQQAFLPTFFRYNEQGVASPNTNFLESATETSANPTRVTLKLNPRAAWADGETITAEDVVATWTACNGRSTGFQCSPDLLFNEIAEVSEGANESEVLLEFDSAYPQWRSIFDRVSVLRAESVADAETFNGWTQLTREWTAGPFVVEDSEEGEQAIVATPNEEWWGADKPQLARLTIKEIPRENQVKAYADAEIDAVDIAGSKEFFDAVRTVPEHAIRRAGSQTYRQLVFNTSSPSGVNVVGVRQASAIALARSGVGTAALPGIEFTAAPVGNRIFLPGQDGYADNAEALELTRDVGQARKLLNDAGWRESDGVRSRDGQRLEIRLARIQGLAMSENEAAAITEQLAQVGVTVALTDVSLEDFDNGSVLSGGDFDMIVTGIEGGRYPLADLDDRYGSGAEQNWARLEEPAIDDLIGRIDAEQDPAQQRTLANDLDRLLWEQMPTVPLYQLPESIAVGVRLTNYGAPGLASIAWENVGFVRG
ncbi:MAG: ABC transporter family substrate-binding protein [Propionibacteriaceae bacterium]|nr:ABC transporter family substrate-binding protein [Propionibacteriaceae bacterium]